MNKKLANAIAAKESPATDSSFANISASDLQTLRAKYPEGIPAWMANLDAKQIDDAMQLRRRAFPKTAR